MRGEESVCARVLRIREEGGSWARARAPLYWRVQELTCTFVLLCPRQSCRRSSIVGKSAGGGGGGGMGGGGAKADPRPITSKAFQGDTIAAVVEYCQASSYRAGPISAKILSSPTGKDFASIVSHLCQRIDASYVLVGRLEDEVQTAFKVLRYARVVRE